MTEAEACAVVGRLEDIPGMPDDASWMAGVEPVNGAGEWGVLFNIKTELIGPWVDWRLHAYPPRNVTIQQDRARKKFVAQWGDGPEGRWDIYGWHVPVWLSPLLAAAWPHGLPLPAPAFPPSRRARSLREVLGAAR